MLVLSRRQNDKVVFPNLGISVEILRITGNSVRVGVQAPPEVKVFRHEVAEKDGLMLDPDTLKLPQKSLSHKLRNRLNTVTLAMRLVQKQLENGWNEEAERTLEKALADFTSIDREIGSMTAASSGQQPPRRALLVEDDANESALLAGFLRASGIAVDSANDGYKAIDYLTSHDHPDVVLLDMQMPGCDGPTTIAAIRSNPQLKGLRVYGVSGREPGECGVNVGPGGVDCWFSKPLDPRTLVHKLDQIVRQPAAAS